MSLSRFSFWGACLEAVYVASVGAIALLRFVSNVLLALAVGTLCLGGLYGAALLLGMSAHLLLHGLGTWPGFGSLLLTGACTGFALTLLGIGVFLFLDAAYLARDRVLEALADRARRDERERKHEEGGDAP